METNKQTIEKSKKKKWLVLLLLLLTFLVGGIYFMNRSNEPVGLMSKELLPPVGDASDRTIGERAQELADANYFTLTINPVAQFEDGSSEGTLQIINPETNVYPISVVVTLDETGEEVYVSGAIHPNQEVNKVRLLSPLERGEHPATATVSIFNPETLEKQGATQAALTISIEN